jgi:hypothetical protein
MRLLLIGILISLTVSSGAAVAAQEQSFELPRSSRLAAEGYSYVFDTHAPAFAEAYPALWPSGILLPAESLLTSRSMQTRPVQLTYDSAIAMQSTQFFAVAPVSADELAWQFAQQGYSAGYAVTMQRVVAQGMNGHVAAPFEIHLKLQYGPDPAIESFTVKISGDNDLDGMTYFYGSTLGAASR